jgi:cytochrome P450
MQDSRVDEAIASHKTYGSLEQQHELFSMLRRDDPVHWTELEESIGRLARESIDRMVAHGGACDFYNDVVVRFPLKVIMLILGIPDEHGQHLLDITRAYFGGGDPEMQRGNDLIDATRAYMDFFRVIARERRSHPTDDVATLIATAEVDGSLIGEFEASSYFVALASAGHDTTSATLAGGPLALIQNPDEMRKLRANPDLIPAAVDEMVRWVSPVPRCCRRRKTGDPDTILIARPLSR